MQLSIIRTLPTTPGGAVELSLVGSIDLATRQAFLDAAAEALSVAPALVIDAGAVDFVDSTGISALVELGQMAERRGATVEIRRQSAQLRRVLGLVGLQPLSA